MEESLETGDISTLRASDESHVAADLAEWRLEVVHSPDADSVGAAVPLEREGTLLVGRDVTEGLRVRDAKVSRLHLRVVWDRQQVGFRYGDCGSANGTFVNGSPAASGLLLPNDVIRVGDTLLVCVERDLAAELKGRAQLAARTSLHVLVRGETGAGKELLVRDLHSASGRPGPFVAVNCAALPGALAAAELFGHTPGAFSGARGARRGLYRSADQGTLLLDEIGDLALELQGQLLRTLQEGKVRPVGSDTEFEVDVRVVAATHRDLDEAQRCGQFRQDLLHRLAHIVLDVPPLRARRAEILRLVREFAPALEFTPSAAEALLTWDWPGNVRELRALAEAQAATGDSREPIGVANLAARLPAALQVANRSSTPVHAAKPSSPAERRERLAALLRRHKGNVTEVSRELGKPRAQVYRWLRAVGLSKDDFR